MKSFSRRQAIATMGGMVAAVAAVGRSEPTQSRSAASSGIERDPAEPSPLLLANKAEVQQQLAIRDQHLRLIQVILQDQTDIHNELVQCREWLLHPCEKLELQGNLFVIEHTLSGEGRVLLKLAPLPHARSVQTAADLQVVPRRDTGFDLNLLRANGTGEFVELPYAGGAAGRTRALQRFQRSRSRFAPSHRTPRFLSNTWGDRSQDSRICRQFVEKEIAAGARLGVEVVQIDDGWQKGISKNSARAGGNGVWEGFWRTQADFWEPDPVKFPGGLGPLARQAKAQGMALGLWYAPDSVDEFANWEKDAGCLTGFFRNHGIAHFKIDSVYAPSARAQANLDRLFSTVLRDTGGGVVFDQDVTAGLRPGYFGMLGTGPLFVENRYTDWHRYWPHQTLRNLWQLAWWIDPSRLRMEFLNQSRNTDKYPDDPLAPARYAPETLFATVFFSNPLGWFEVSNLPAAYFDRVAPLVGVWKRLREELFSGTIIPLGTAPDGVSWSGFASIAEGSLGAIVLAFRELNPAATTRLAIAGYAAGSQTKCELLAGAGSATWSGEALHLKIDEPLGWALVRLTS